MTKPKLVITLGDPSGIGPELIAKLLADETTQQVAHILLIGDAHLLRQGGRQAGIDIVLNTINEADVADFQGCAQLHIDTISESDVRPAEVTEAGGRASLRCLDKALDLATRGLVDGVLFAPLNKAAMTKAGLVQQDEHQYIASYINFDGHHGEVNVLDELMTTRVTSHIALKDVAAHITSRGIADAIQLAHDTLRQAGKARPAIAVAALNPHAGDNGKFGREEIDVIAPVVESFRQKQMNISGPWPSDTVFLKAKRREVDAVVTMYHDQGQIAMKLIGFDRGVTLVGGLPIPIATPAHGTAFDIVGQNRADLGATRQAFNLLLRMTANHHLSM